MKTETVVGWTIVAAFAVCGMAWGRWKWVGRGGGAIIVVVGAINSALRHTAESKRALAIAFLAVAAFALGVLLRQLTSAASRRDLRREADGLPGGVPVVVAVIVLAVAALCVGAALPQPAGRRVVLVTVLFFVLLAMALFVRKLWSDVGRHATGLGNLYRPAVPVEVGRTASVLAAMAGASALNLLLVKNERTQFTVALLFMFALVVLLTGWQRAAARQLGLLHPRDLPLVPSRLRAISLGLGAVAVPVLALSHKFFTGWWAVLMTLLLAGGDVIQRRAYADLLAGRPVAPAPPPRSWHRGAEAVAIFIATGAGFGFAMHASVPHRSVTVSVVQGILFGAFMAAFMTRLQNRQRSGDTGAGEPPG